MLLIIDNYDSFTYNLYQYIGEMYPDIAVYRNDAVTCEEIEGMRPSAIVLSPGPGYPDSAGITLDAVRRFAGRIPMLGVCLGHQSIVQAMGGRIIHAKELMHGKQCGISLDGGCPLFDGLPEKIKVARYHSLAADTASLPSCLKVTARAADGEIMAVQHNEYPLYGLQFHPESVITEHGKQMLKNFLTKVCGLTTK